MPEVNWKYVVHETKILEKFPNAEYANKLMERLMKVFKVLVERRKTRVLFLTEFYPRSDSLQGLNANRGEKILIRFRKPEDKNKFFSFPHCLCTCCHELAHNWIGPHNEKFWALYKELVSEAEIILVEQQPAQIEAKKNAWKRTGGHVLGSNDGDQEQQQNQNQNQQQQQEGQAAVAFTGVGRRLGGEAGGGGGENNNNNNNTNKLPPNRFLQNQTPTGMRELILGAALRRIAEKQEEQYRLEDSDNGCSGCGGGHGIDSIFTQQEIKSRNSSRNNTQQQENQNQNIHHDVEKNEEENGTWPCDICGRICSGTYCTFCCGTEVIDVDAINSSDEEDDNNNLAAVKKEPRQEEEEEVDDDDDDEDDDEIQVQENKNNNNDDDDDDDVVENKKENGVRRQRENSDSNDNDVIDLT